MSNKTGSAAEALRSRKPLNFYYNASQLRFNTWHQVRRDCARLSERYTRQQDVSRLKDAVDNSLSVLESIEDYTAFPSQEDFRYLWRLFRRAEYTEMIESEDRLSYLDGIVNEDCSNPEILVQRFLQAPLFRDTYALGYGTVFTSVYLPARGEIWYCWLKKNWRFAFGAFRELKQRITYRDPAASAGDQPVWPPLPPRNARVVPGIIIR